MDAYDVRYFAIENIWLKFDQDEFRQKIFG
jgi:hypothetical protein